MERHLRSQSVMLQVWARLLDVLRRSKRLNRLGDYPRCVLALSVSRSESAEEGIEITQIGEKISLKVQEFLETGKIQEASTFWNSFLHSFKDMRLSVRDPTRYSWFEDEWEIPRFERITNCTRNRFARRFSLPMSHCAALIGSFRLGQGFNSAHSLYEQGIRTIQDLRDRNLYVSQLEHYEDLQEKYASLPSNSLSLHLYTILMRR